MIAIQFENVGKLYRLGTVGTGTLSHDLNRWWKTRVLHQEDPYLKIGEVNNRATHGESDYVWALKDISFSVEEGDVVGIIGKNGAGKSTLLKLLSQITSPTTGVIRARGRIGSLLEVGTGFHQEMTGRENIYMNGSIMGMTRQEITRKLDEIIDFAGIARYIDTPVKRYSSGMTVRLGFAVAAFMEPEILVVDEVLAVGDAEFQKKAIGKMQDISRGQGRTVLFVSHNMAAVRSLCQRGVVLKDGMMDFEGGMEEAIMHYIANHQRQTEDMIINRIKRINSYLKIHHIWINGSESTYSYVQTNQRFLDIVIEGTTKAKMKTDIMVFIRNREGVPLASLAEGHYRGKTISVGIGDFILKSRILLPRFLNRGVYILDLYLHDPSYEFQMKIPNCVELEASGSQEGFGKALYVENYGFCGLETEDISLKQ